MDHRGGGAADFGPVAVAPVPGIRRHRYGDHPTEELVLPLAEDTRLTLTGRDNIAVTVEIAGGRVRFLESGCPDRLCVDSGWLSAPGTGAACVPAGILLRLNAAGEVDAVAG